MMGNQDAQHRTILGLKEDLHTGKQEILNLRKIIGDLKKGNDHLISITEHEDLLQCAEKRARQAEMKALAFESELNKRYDNGLYKTTLIPMELQERHLSEQPKPRWNKSHMISQPSPRFHQRRLDFKRCVYDTNPASSARVLCQENQGTKEQFAQDPQRSQDRTQLIDEEGLNKPKKSFLSRMRQSVFALKFTRHKSTVPRPAGSKLPVASLRTNTYHQSMLFKVQSTLFGRRRVMRSICDLPDLSSLHQCKSHEAASGCQLMSFNETPLVVGDTGSDEDSGWSTSDEVDAAQRKTTKRKTTSRKERPPPLPPKPKSVPTPTTCNPTSTSHNNGSQEQLSQASDTKQLKSQKRAPFLKEQKRPTQYTSLT